MAIAMGSNQIGTYQWNASIQITRLVDPYLPMKCELLNDVEIMIFVMQKHQDDLV